MSAFWQCQIDGCESIRKTAELCPTHYSQKRAAEKRAAATPGTCRFDECAEIPTMRGLCKIHYRQAKIEGYLNEIALPRMNGQEPVPDKNTDTGYRMLNKQGYVIVRGRDWTNYLEHRVAMETLLGRSLVKSENVHHINGVRHDNRIENLELWFSPQPYGQRVEQLIAYMAESHPVRMMAALAQNAPSRAITARSGTNTSSPNLNSLQGVAASKKG